MKKIVDVPEGAEEFLFEAYENDMLVGKTQEGYVSSLPDAPTVAENATLENRMIELSADVIEGVQNAKTHYCGNVADFVLNAPSVVFPEIRKAIGEPNASYDKVADILGSWYFGNIDFAPKKEPKFVVEVDMHDEYGNLKRAHVWQNDKHGAFTPYIDGEKLPSTHYNYKEFSEDQADKLVSGLTALNARKVKVEG